MSNVHNGSTNSESKRLALLIVGAIGVVYGDIGTSPLYAFKESFLGGLFQKDFNHILAILSLIFWSITISITIKYVILMMRADNKGEGGSLSLFALASRFSHATKWAAVVPALGIFAASLFYSDSIITPAISVLSALDGLQIVSPEMANFTMPLTLIILTVLFVCQKYGTGQMGKFFGPIMCTWFVVLAALGIANIIENPAVLKAINPYYAISFFVTEPLYAFLILGSIVLAITGAEALYADMGHFGKTPIRLAWTGLIFPSLILNYFGQGAFIQNNPDGASNPFFLMAPEWMYWPLIIMSTLATIIASQAVITGAFSVTKQAIALGYLPRMSVVHTSNNNIGQIYIPFVNWMLFIFIVVLVLSFQTSSNLIHAYGFAVTGTMLINTILLGIVMFKIWNWKKIVIIPVLTFFLTVDITFFAANSMKIPSGAWFPLLLASVIFFTLMTWKRGRNLVLDKIKTQAMPIDVFFRDYCDGFSRVDGTAIYMSNLSEGIPIPLLMNLKHNKIMHERNLFLHVTIEEKAYVREKDRIKIVDLGQDFYRVIIRYGFMDIIDVPKEIENLQSFGLRIDQNEATYFIGRETVVPTEVPGMALWREHFFAWMSRNSSSVVDFYKLPSRRVMELGSRIDI